MKIMILKTLLFTHAFISIEPSNSNHLIMLFTMTSKLGYDDFIFNSLMS